MEPKSFQKIFDCISDYLPTNWRKLAFYFAFSGNMSSHKFYVDMGNGYVDCFHMGYTKEILNNIFFPIEDILIEERENMPENKRWSIFTMFAYSTGKFEANYEYGDISKTFVEHQKQWEEKNINLK